MKNGLTVALLVFVVLLFAVIGLRGKDDKVGVQEMKVARVEKDKVTRIEVSFVSKAPAPAEEPAPAPPPARARAVLEKVGDAWKVLSPEAPDKKYDADEALVKGALDAIGELEVGDLIANKADKLAGYDIDDDKGQTVKVFVGTAPVLDLVVGRAAKSGGTTVRQAGSNDVHVAKGRLGAATKKDVTGWRKKSLVDVKADEIVRVATTFANGSTLVLEQAPAPPPPAAAPGEEAPPPPPPEWKLVEPAALPEGFRLDASLLGRAAGGLASLRAVDFAEGVGDDVTGLGASHTVVEAKTKGGTVVQLHIGAEDAQKRTYARVGSDAQLYLLAAFNVKQIVRSLDDLRDLSLVATAVEDVERVTFSGESKVVVRQKDGSWQLVEPKVVPEGFSPSQIGTQVAAVLRLKAARVVTDVPKDAFAKVGPAVEVVLKSGAKQTIRFGAPVPTADGAAGQEPREYFVRSGVDELAYVVPAFTRNRYNKPTEMFRAPPPSPGMGAGQVPGMENLPPDVRKKLQEAMAKGSFSKGAH